MNINEIQKFFDSEDVPGLLTKLQPNFDEVDSAINIFKDGMANGQACQDMITELTGYYMYLNVVLSIAESELRYKEGKLYNQHKIETEKQNKKFVSSAIDRQVTVEVNDYRRIRNILHAYVDDCKTAISTCQSVLKSISEEQKV